MNIEHDGSYEGTMNDLDNMTSEELYNKSQYADSYSDNDEVYELIKKNMWQNKFTFTRKQRKSNEINKRHMIETMYQKIVLITGFLI